MAIFLVYVCVFMPYFMAFPEASTPLIQGSFYFIDFLFLVDMILIFNTAFYTKSGTMVNTRKEIAKNYLKLWFWIDLVSIIPLELLLDNLTLTENTK